MAGNPPVEVTIEKVLSEPGDPWGGGDGKSKMRTYDEVLFADDQQTRKVYVPEGIELADGVSVKGWFNSQKGTWTIADPNPPQNGSQSRSTTSTGSASRDDATGKSIERQVAAYAAAYMASAVGGNGPVVAANFEEFFDLIHAKIVGTPVLKPDAS